MTAMYIDPEFELRRVPWPNGAKVAVAVDLILEAWQTLPPVSTALTPTFPKEAVERGLTDHATSSWQLFGGRSGFFRLTEILRAYDCPAAVYVSALAAERWPDQVAAFAGAGNEVVAHAYSQDHRMYFMDADADRAEVRRCAEVLEKVTGARPVGWSSPGGQRGDHTLTSLLAEDYLYCADFSDREVPYVVHEDAGRRLWALPGSSVNDVAIMRNGHETGVYVDVFCRMIDQLRFEGDTRPSMMSAIVHSTHLGRPHGGWALRQCLEYARRFDDVWLCRPRDIVEHYVNVG
jgi:peptidoglycan/xylan/chitin deacetylase (PgdA/CDA1 family)